MEFLLAVWLFLWFWVCSELRNHVVDWNGREDIGFGARRAAFVH
jgi:hypothetical protein